MNKSTKPEFIDRSGALISPDRLPAEALKRLALHLPAQIQGKKRANFLRLTSEAVDFWEQNKSKNSMTATEISERIEKMEDAAKALRRAIEGLQGDPYDAVSPHFVYLIWGSAPPIKLPEQLRQDKVEFGSLLTDTWATLQVLGETGKYARSHIHIDRTAKPTMQSARSLAFWVAESYRRQFGDYPPVHKSAWFPAYMTELGDILQIRGKFGYSMLGSVIKAMRKNDLAG